MTKFLTKLTALDQELGSALVHQQVKEIQQIDAAVKNKEVPLKAPQELGLLPDQFETVLNEVGAQQKENLMAINNLLNNFRQYLSLKYGIWSLPNLQTAGLIKEKLQVNSALEIMAGNAYWSLALAKAGLKVVSTDSLEWAKTSKTGAQPFYPVLDMPAEAAIKRYREVDLILCSWSPNFGQADLGTIQAWRQSNSKAHLLFIGEKNGATNSPAFWRQNWFKKTPALAQINQSFKSFDFIDEQVFEIDDKF